MVAPLLLYNQSTSNDDDFIANFVARHDVLDTLLRRLRNQTQQAEGAHQILIGARGMGKSSLLRRLAIAVGADPDLNRRLIPLTFREEQYNVLTCGDFWRNCGEALAEWAEKTGDNALAERLDAALASSLWAGDEAPAEQFAAELDQLQRRALLLVDNLDLILDAIAADAHWSLRKQLQHRNGPIMIGAATHPLSQSANRDAAFYEFFQPHHLEPLDERETEQCMRALAHARGAQGRPVLQVLNTQPERLKTLHALTGGNPRVLTLIYRLLEAAESDEAMADLDILLDQVTPYYKARIEEYQTAQQRAVIDAIALNWDPITAADIARLTNIAATTLPNLLAKLRKDGLIELTELSGASAGHQIAERFFNIWYLMRHGTRRTKHKMRWLVGFLSIFYSAHDLADIDDRVTAQVDLKQCNPDFAYAVREARRLKAAAIRVREVLAAFSKGEGEGAKLAGDDGLTPGHRAALTVFEEAMALEKVGDKAAAVAIYDDIVSRFDEAVGPDLRALVAGALHRKAENSQEMGDNAAAVAAYDDVVGRFEGAVEPVLQVLVAGALFNRAVILGELGGNAAKIVAYDDIIARFGDAVEPVLRLLVASALFNRAVALREVGDTAAAVAACDDIVARFGDSLEPALREQVAGALGNKAVALREVGDTAAAVAACDDIVARFGDSLEPALRDQSAKALLYRALTLDAMGDNAAAVLTFDDIVARFGDAVEPVLCKLVALALFHKAVILHNMGERIVAISAYDECIARFDSLGQMDSIELILALARIALANLLIETRNDLASAEALYAAAETAIPQVSNYHLAWVQLLNHRLTDAHSRRDSLADFSSRDCALLDAAFELAEDNFGLAMEHLGAVLRGERETSVVSSAGTLYRLIRFAERKGYGERLVGWLEESGLADRLAPLYAAVKAYVRGEQVLLDINPETRGPARIIYDRLAAPRRGQPQAATPAGKAPRRRGRPRKA